MTDKTFSVNEKFITELTTALLSSAVVYIPHFNYTYVDKALRQILNSGVLGLSLENIAEICDAGPIKFDDKSIIGNLSPKDAVSHFTEDAEIGKKAKVFNKEMLLLYKNAFVQLQDTHFQRTVQTFASKYERGEYDRRVTLILVSPQSMEELPSEIEKLITVVEIPRPTEEEIYVYINQSLPVSQQSEAEGEDLKTELTRTLQGLQQYEIEQIINAIAARTGGYLTKQSVKYALNEKKSIVRKSGIIEVIDTDISFDQVGGLENLREDLEQKAILFRHLGELRNVNLPLPKGILVLGMPGCGKSLVAKSIANEFGVSLLRLDVNRLMGQYVGQSEGNLRKALATAEAAHPCVLWIDEIEKAFAGANGSGGGNDIVMRLMGHFLTWMQERKTAVYIVATANDVMRPEFMRKGRFDEVYFVDFPTLNERKDILSKKLKAFNKTINQQKVFDLSKVTTPNVIDELSREMCANKSLSQNSTVSNGFSGSEIQSVVESVMERKYIEYLTNADKAKAEGKKEVGKVNISKEDFLKEINKIKGSVMAGQVGKTENGVKEKTSVERIRDLQEVYNFRTATKN